MFHSLKSVLACYYLWANFVGGRRIASEYYTDPIY